MIVKGRGLAGMGWMSDSDVYVLLLLPYTIANFCSLPLLSFGQALGKLQGKVVTHSEEVGWWRTLMVECLTLF